MGLGDCLCLKYSVHCFVGSSHSCNNATKPPRPAWRHLAPNSSRKRSASKSRLSASEKLSPEDQAYVDELEHRKKMDDLAFRVDVNWSDMPLEKLRRAGEIGWDIDPDGPTGPEKFDNVYNKVNFCERGV